MTADAADGRGHPANPLQRLIRQRLHDRHWSYGQVARRGGLPRSTVYTLATNRNLARPPRPDTIDALARGLDVPVSAVRTAAAESAGLHYYDQATPGRQPPGDRERDLLIASIDELSPDARRHVAALVESLLHGHSSSSPRRLPGHSAGCSAATVQRVPPGGQGTGNGALYCTNNHRPMARLFVDN
jgi:transcriptional regulator with XRE-family HTH domain